MKQLKFILFILLGITILNLWQSCAKGPEDPFISFHSRLSRVSGNWNITEYKINNKDSLRRVGDSIGPYIGFCGSEIDKVILNYKYIWTFEKNGVFQEKLTIDSSYIYDIANNTPICKDSLYRDSSTTVTILTWNFTSNVGDLKNKEQLYILDPYTKKSLLFDIIELRNNEMKLERDTIDPFTSIAYQRSYTLSRIK
ncbi:MAG: hypothetical protein IPO83_01440 [Chitinophagaceae bacterium]|nr:hypothetical protein [Chitinophagaceae bacterium]